MVNKRELGKTGIMITELGYGCTAQFGKDFLGKQSISEHQAFSLVSAALDSGIRFFDTGFNYGYAEERLGRCLSSLFAGGTWKREDVVIQTKGCETLNADGTYGPNDYSPEWIKRSVEISLKRLKLDYIDLYALHGATPQVLTDELFDLFEDLKRQKIIRAYGVCGISDDFGYWISSKKCFDYIMMTYNYAEARRNPLIEHLNKNGIGILTGGSLNRSMNTISWFPRNRKELWYLARAVTHYRKELVRANEFDFVKNVDGMTPQQISLSYVLNNKNITSATFNTLSIEHLKDNINAIGMGIPSSILEKIESIK